MTIKTDVTRYDFHEAFKQCGRGNQFSSEGLDLIYDYLNDNELTVDAVSVKIIDLDVIMICCHFAEYDSLKDFQYDYGDEYVSMDMIEDNTIVLQNKDSNSFVIEQF
tara:strand:- start:316 stop:636 length:321 start_codon:yes stop_codon:yes gene_type:complete